MGGRQRALVAEMKIFTPWPNQQCEACSRNQCSEGVPMGKCCFTKRQEFEVGQTCTLNLAIADTKDITQVVAPASQSHTMQRSLNAKASTTQLAIGGEDMRTAFEKTNAGLFVIAMPQQEERMMRLARDSFRLPHDRIVLVPGVANQSSNYSTLISRGIVAKTLSAEVTDAELPPARVAAYLAHLRAHKMFL